MPPGAFVALLRAVGSPKDPGEPEDLEAQGPVLWCSFFWVCFWHLGFRTHWNVM